MQTLLILFVATSSPIGRTPTNPGRVVDVSTVERFREALANATTGEGVTIRVAPGMYRGGISARGVKGSAGTPVVIRAADPENPPVFTGGTGLHIAHVEHLEIHDLVLVGSSANGLNIDDGGTADHPSHHLLLRGLVARDVGPRGNRDGIKLSGIDDFRVENCALERWGDGGSGIDMVGCHRGAIEGCRFRHGDTVGSNAIQIKGGSRAIEVRHCRFEHAGERAVNIGGSTGLPFFRPRPEGYEAKDVIVEDCTFLGSATAVAFVGVDGAEVRRNTIHAPGRWAFRILQETRAPGFVPSRNGRVVDNLIVFRSNEMVGAVNVGDATAPETFTFSGNAWYCIDAPARSKPQLPVAETGGQHGVDPRFVDPEKGDLRLRPDSPLRDKGARPSPK